MTTYIIIVLANCIHICNKNKNNILKYLLLNYAKKILSNKQLILLHIKLLSVNENTNTYIFFNNWIELYDKKIIKQLLYFNLD